VRHLGFGVYKGLGFIRVLPHISATYSSTYNFKWSITAFICCAER
jgi:hypothetical protein